MRDEKIEILRKEFVEKMNELGIKNIKEIPVYVQCEKEHKEVWVIK